MRRGLCSSSLRQWTNLYVLRWLLLQSVSLEFSTIYLSEWRTCSKRKKVPTLKFPEQKNHRKNLWRVDWTVDMRLINSENSTHLRAFLVLVKFIVTTDSFQITLMFLTPYKVRWDGQIHKMLIKDVEIYACLWTSVMLLQPRTSLKTIMRRISYGINCGCVFFCIHFRNL